MAVRNPLGEKNIIVIDDNYSGGCSEAYAEAGRKISSIMKKYTGIMKKLVEDGSLKGNTADRLQAFAETADMLLAQTAEILGSNKKAYMESYVNDIDRADKEIY